MALDFEATRDLAKQKIKEREATHEEKPLTEQEQKDVEFLVGEMETYVQKYANDGKQSFLYVLYSLLTVVLFRLV